MGEQANVWEVFRTYNGQSIILLFFAASIIYFWITSEKKYRIIIPIALGVISICFYNNYFYGLVKSMGFVAEYYRFLWILPIIALSAVMFTDIFGRIKYGAMRCVLLLVILLLCVVGGKAFITSEGVKTPENIYGVAQRTVDVGEIIAKDRGDRRSVVLGDAYIDLTIRQYDANNVLAISRENHQAYYSAQEVPGEVRVMCQLVNHDGNENPEGLRKALRDYSVEYIVIQTQWVDECKETMDFLGYELIGSADYYSAYAIKDEYRGELVPYE